MTMDVFTQGELVVFERTFTAIDDVTSLTLVSCTLTLLDPAGELHDVELDDPSIDNVSQPPTATFTGELAIPLGNDTAGQWAERWETGEDLEDAATIYWRVKRDPVLGAELASA